MAQFERCIIELLDSGDLPATLRDKYGNLDAEALKAILAKLQAQPWVGALRCSEDFETFYIEFKQPMLGDLDAVEYDLEGKVADCLGDYFKAVETVFIPTPRIRRRNGEITQ